MRILQRTNDWFREGVPVRMIRVESLITMWIRLVGCPKITQPLNLEVMEYPMEYLPKAKSLRAGMLDVVLADFKNANAWERGILLQRTMTGYMVFLIDWELESEQCLSSIRLLPRNLAKMAPWVRKIILPGVRDQPNQAKIPRSPIIGTLTKLFFSMYNNSCMYSFVCMVLYVWFYMYDFVCMILYVWLYVQFYVDICIFLYILVLNCIFLVKTISE